MVIPKKLRPRVEDMTREEAVDLFALAHLISKKLERQYNCTSLNFGCQDGAESGQSIRVIYRENN
jgi:diadenosine tetraphosphate (Ap4A) HIT family hydrolase